MTTAPTGTARIPAPRAAKSRTAVKPVLDLAALSLVLADLPLPTLVADPAGEIVFVNATAELALASYDRHLAVAATRVPGSSLDTLGFLADTTLELGAEAIEVTHSPLLAADGVVLGTVVSWQSVTPRLEADRRAGEAAEAIADSAAVSTVLQVIMTASTVDEVTRLALDTVRDAFGWAYGSYWKIDAADNTLKFVLESGDAGEEFRKVTLAASFAEGVGLSGRAWKTRDLFFTQDIGEMTDCVRAPVAQKVGVKSGICFPVIVAGQVVGTMDFFATETLTPSTQRLDSLRNVGRLVSQALTRIAETERQNEAAADTDAVNTLLQKLGTAETFDSVTRLALDTVRDTFGWAYGSFWSHRRSRQRPAEAFVGRARGWCPARTSRPGHRGGVVRGRESACRAGPGRPAGARSSSRTSADDHRLRPSSRRRSRAGVKSGICFPILVEGNVLIGTMDFFATETLQPFRAADSRPCAPSAGWCPQPSSGSPGHRAQGGPRQAEAARANAELQRQGGSHPRPWSSSAAAWVT